MEFIDSDRATAGGPAERQCSLIELRSDRATQTQDNGALATPYAVDNNGNVTQRGTDTFGYDQANRMTSLRIGATTASYTFDGDGKRASSTVGVTTTNYVYDVGGGLPVLLDEGTHKYVWGLGLAYTTDEPGNLQGVYHTDGLGSVRAMTDANGSVVQTYGTDEFGITDATLTTGTTSQSMQYTGEQRDSESSFMYLRARMYDPNVGRFMQADPLRKSAPGVGGWNRYSYADNNPTNSVDPTGLRTYFVGAVGAATAPITRCSC